MAFGPVKYFPAVTVASGASTSSGLEMAKIYNNVSVRVGTMSTAMVTRVQGSYDGGTTYFDCMVVAASSVTQVNSLVIGTSAGVNGGLVTLPYRSFPFNNIRFVLTGVVSGGCSFTVVTSE